MSDTPTKATFTDLEALDAHVIKQEEYEDIPALTDEELARATRKRHDVYPWCWDHDDDRLLRSFVFEAMIPLDLKDKLAAMQAAFEWIKDGKSPPKLTAVK